ncbi:MAG TPA: hypothetical protein DCS07_00980 [Bdellovibrionales bacterium]|nr:hypothetical protein [Bdellovibrionales bacterium]HCM41135.1 hypothetical protein [Bdellovibrionales bacterium]
MNTAASDFMDVGSAATYLRIKVATLYAWVHQRRIPFRKHGRRVVFFKPELLKWSENQAVSPLAPSTSISEFPAPGFDASVVHSSLKTRRIVDCDLTSPRR